MCTATWYGGNDGFRLLFNRDEMRTRSPALPATVYERDGVQWIAPRDPDGGGTWIFVNALGLAVCLLNRYAGANDPQTPVPGAPRRSRGRLMTDLATCANIDAVARHLTAADLTVYPGFDLVVLQPGPEASRFAWDGRNVRRAPASAGIVSSSSFQTERVLAGRFDRFQQRFPRADDRDGPGWDADALRAFHRSHAPERGADSVCMHRPDAHTVGFTEIHMTADHVILHDQPGAPCKGGALHTLQLARHRG